jgi:hypothetical protein
MLWYFAQCCFSEVVMVQSEETESCCVESAIAESEILDLQLVFSTVHSADQVRKQVIVMMNQHGI